MSFADEDELAAFLGRDAWLSMTEEAVAEAMEGFSLHLLPGKDMVWVAMATRRALAISLRHEEDGPDRTSLSEVKAELGRLADLVASTWTQLFQRAGAVDSRIWTIAWRHWDGEGGNVSEPLDYRRFNAALKDMDWLAGFLRQAARETESPKGAWRSAERKRLRIERGQYLAPIFEAAFGEPVSANNFPDDARHRAPTPFMDFYRRMITLAFGARETINLADVTKAACRRHRQFPAQFGEGIIPGL